MTKAMQNAAGGKRKREQDSQQQSSRQRKRIKAQDARAIAVQTTGNAYANGEIDIEKFVRARKFEIQALEDGMKRAKKSLSNRAFQNVPRELRRRTASHNVKKVPKRLRARAAKEMVEDNTPTGSARKKKLSKRARLRSEKWKTLQKLKSQPKSKKECVENALVTKVIKDGISKKPPRTKKNVLRKPLKPKAKFRKRQIFKSWLPTHLFHAKRAHMTPPKQPLWRMAIPISPTVKSYRPTHRSSTLRGAVAWDMSYMSTIGLEGPEKGIKSLLNALGVGKDDHESFWDSAAALKWISGARHWEGWLYERNSWPRGSIAPAMVLWCREDVPVDSTLLEDDGRQQKGTEASLKRKKTRRQVLIRVHPSSFLQLWEETVRLGKIQQPSVAVEDLRFEIGSIEIVGPAATDVLLNVLRPTKDDIFHEKAEEPMSKVFAHLRNITSAATMPKNALLGFNVTDPRLHHGYKERHPKKQMDANQTLQVLSNWPVDELQTSPKLFSSLHRRAAGRSLASQKSINRRKALAGPGKEPEVKSTDAAIPVILCARRNGAYAQGSWVLMLPWKYVQPIWYCLMYTRIKTGGTIRFGGLDELRQIAFESGVSWFPGDEPGTKAGQEWESRQASEKKAAWERKPRGRRVAFASLDLGAGQKGEIGQGWSCDWATLLGEEWSKIIYRMPSSMALKQLRNKTITLDVDEPTSDGGVVSVKITLLARGAVTTCARIYRLPTNEEVREKWLQTQPKPKTANSKAQKYHGNSTRKEIEEMDPMLRRQRLAQQLLQAPPPPSNSGSTVAGHADYPEVPGQTDLIGFVTTGNFNLGEGRSTAIGNIQLSRVIEQRRQHAAMGLARSHEHLCIVRESGQVLGRLARWEVIS